MGRPIPEQPRWSPQAPPGEEALWSWAVDQLPDRVRILPSVHLTEVSAHSQDAEVDLVLVDPAWGVLCVEVKGGVLSYDARHHRWFRDHGGGQRRVLVRDAAGTGKTQLAVHAAATQAATGARVLLGCWNVPLGRWLERRVGERLAAMGSPLADGVRERAHERPRRVVRGL